jgi:hypothetical protein
MTLYLAISFYPQEKRRCWTYRKRTVTVNARPKPSLFQSSIGFGSIVEYKCSFLICQLKIPSIITTNENHASFATSERLKRFRSKKWPQKISAEMAATPDINAPSALDRPEKYSVI